MAVHALQVSVRRSNGGSVVVRGSDPAGALVVPVDALAGTVQGWLGRHPGARVLVRTPDGSAEATTAAEVTRLVHSVAGSPPAVVPADADADVEALAGRVRVLAPEPERILLGLAGVPGAGKSTAAERLAGALGAEAVVVPLDGFHLSNQVLAEQGKALRKGAIDTFDVAGFRALLERIRSRDEVVYAPVYLREYEEAIAGSIAVDPAVRIVITEGNYLLADGWDRVRAVLDAVWYVETDDELRLQRLIARHVEFGKSPEQAAAWATGSDENNARLIRKNRGTADLIVRGG